MRLLYKQLTKGILKNKVFVVLILVMTVFTSFMYFFVHYSIDGNIKILNALPTLKENQILYKKALTSNIILARSFFISLIGLTSFVFGMFFYHFIKIDKKQLGCLKSLGFKDNTLCSCFIFFTTVISLCGALIGLGAGYFASSVLINANKQSYSMTGIVKELSIVSIFVGLFLPNILFCIVTLLSYRGVRGKECGLLLFEASNQQKDKVIRKITNKFVNLLPVKNKLPIRIALQKPIAVLMIVIAVMGFSVMFIIGHSLNASSQTIFISQTQGHHYLFDTHFNTYQQLKSSDSGIMYYLEATGTIERKNSGQRISQHMIGIENNNALLELSNSKGEVLPTPKEGNVYINSSLHELYGFQVGDKIVLNIDENEFIMTISGIAFNAKSNGVYLAKTELQELLGLSEDIYNGILSMSKPSEGDVVTFEQRISTLKRNAVSNGTSAVINQTIGCLVGCILIFLALLLNFQDSTRDIIILHLIGYQAKPIKKMLINVYYPFLWVSFLLTLLPSIQIAKSVQKSLSIQTGDYMPFHTNGLVLILIFVLLNMIYFLVQAVFHIGIRRMIKTEDTSNYTNAI